MKKIFHSFALSACILIYLGQGQARAETVVVDVCRWVVESVFIPPTYHDVVSCDADALLCLFVDPSCCVPALCNALPHCTIITSVIDVASHWDDQWVWKCEPQELDPKEELYKWLRQQVPSLDDLLLPGAFEAAKLDIEVMRLASTSIPDKVKSQVMGLIQPFIDDGTAKFSSNDVNSAKVISNDNSNASLYLRDDYGAITLNDLIIIRNEDINTLLKSSYHDHTISEIKSGSVNSDYVEALLLLIHELVHIEQYKSLGIDAFLSNYLLEAVAKGYGSISFEGEAYDFELRVAKTISGDQTPELRVAALTASTFGVSAQAISADQARWMKISKWFQSCIEGKEKLGFSFGSKKIQKSKCAPIAEEQFKINVDREKFPLDRKIALPTEVLKMPKGKKMIVPPRPSSLE